MTAGLFALLFFLPARAQDGAETGYSPYSIYGVGDIYRQGSAYSKTMGGVGIAGRDRRYINVSNPAAITARDTLAFMADFGVVQSNNIYRQGNVRAGRNTFNINNFAFTVPIWRKSAFIFGISPYSSVSYGFSRRITDPSIIGTTGSVEYDANGDGGIYQLYAGGAATFWNRFSVGAQFIYYIGNIEKNYNMSFASDSYRDLETGFEMSLNGISGKFGVQYEQPIKDMYLTVGATYKLANKMGGYVTDFRYGVSPVKTDTLSHRVDTLRKSGNVRMADEIGVGISLRKPEKWTVEFNWMRSGWAGKGLDTTPGFANVGGTAVSSLPFSAAVSNSFRAGFEYIPNRNDIRYVMKTFAYRIGGYYDTAYYKLDGNTVSSYGMTFGITIPMRISSYSGAPLYNSLTLGMDISRRGSLASNMVRETYISFVIGFSIHDVWFVKQRYQ